MRKTLNTLAIALIALLLSSVTASAATIGFSPSSSTLNLGESVVVDIVISDLGGEIVAAYDLDITFNSSRLSVTNISLTSVLGNEGTFEAFYDQGVTPGVADIAGLSLLSDASLLASQGGDTVVLASITFQAIGNGNSALGFNFDAFNDVKGSGALILDLTPISGDIQVGDRMSAPVPEPTSALVFFAGMLVSGHAMRRRKA